MTYSDRIRNARQTGSAAVAFGSLVLFIFLVYANPGNWSEGLEQVAFAKIAAGMALAALAGSWLLYGRKLTIGGTPGLMLITLFTLVGLSAIWSFWPSESFKTFVDGVKY